jgi:hypothetical protein
MRLRSGEMLQEKDCHGERSAAIFPLCLFNVSKRQGNIAALRSP